MDDSITIEVDGDGVGRSVFLRGHDDDGLFGVGHEEWQAKLEESLAQAKDASQRTTEELHNTMNTMARKMEELHNSFPQSFAFQVGKPKHTFEARADGSIEVRIRKGDSELVQIFLNESDLAQRRPELYKKYETLKAADQE